MGETGSNNRIIPQFSWDDIDTVLLDMDGTLLDSYFDDFFWEEYVPKMFAEEYGMGELEARKELLQRYRSVEKTLQWANIDYWSEQLGLDIPELKCKIDHLIQVHPYVIDFLEYINLLGKDLLLVTNAHSKTLDIKLSRTPIGPYFDRIIPAEEIGEAKEQPRFWSKLGSLLDLDRQRTMLVDDNANVLHAARTYGISHLIFVARPSSRREVSYSADFASITYFNELIHQ